MKNKKLSRKIKKNPSNLLLMNPSESEQLIAVESNAYNIQYIKNPTERVQLKAINNSYHGEAIEYILYPTKKACIVACNMNPDNILYIKNCSLEELQELFLSAIIEKHPHLIIADKFKQYITNNLIYDAICLNIEVIKYVLFRPVNNFLFSDKLYEKEYNYQTKILKYLKNKLIKNYGNDEYCNTILNSHGFLSLLKSLYDKDLLKEWEYIN